MHTNVREGYLTECPNVGKFIKNLKFYLSMENEMMDAILKGGDANTVATDWLKAHPDAVGPWLAGVTTFDGGDAAAAVKTALEAELTVRHAGAMTAGHAGGRQSEAVQGTRKNGAAVFCGVAETGDVT